jgi:hypothetical protein
MNSKTDKESRSCDDIAFLYEIITNSKFRYESLNQLLILCEHRNYKKNKFKLCSAIAILAFFFTIACANTPNLAGKWKEIGKVATLELWEDGSFKAVDNQKMAVKGKYSLSENGYIKFEIYRQNSPSEIVNGKYSVQGDILTFTSADGKEIQRYRRQK